MARETTEKKWVKIREEILALKAQGKNAAEIAEIRNRSVDTIRTLLRKYKIQGFI